MGCTRWVVINLEYLLVSQAKVLEYWSPTPLPERDAGKDAAAPANLREPEAADLEVSSDLSIGRELDIEVVGTTVPTNSSTLG